MIYTSCKNTLKNCYIEKLVADLHDKEKHVILIRNLKEALN